MFMYSFCYVYVFLLLLLPPGVNPIAVNKYIISYIFSTIPDGCLTIYLNQILTETNKVWKFPSSDLQSRVVEQVYARVSQMKTLNMFYLVIYWTQNVHNDFIFLCSIVLPAVGHSSNHEHQCWKLQHSRSVVRIFIALSRFSFESLWSFDKESLVNFLQFKLEY